LDHQVQWLNKPQTCWDHNVNNAHVMLQKAHLEDQETVVEMELQEVMVALVMQARVVMVDDPVPLVTKDHLEILEHLDNPAQLVFNVPAIVHHLELLDNLVALDRPETEDHLAELETTAVLEDLDNLDHLDDLEALAPLDNLALLEKAETPDLEELVIIAHHHVWHQDINRRASQALIFFYIFCRCRFFVLIGINLI
jgi:hypothetical protein